MWMGNIRSWLCVACLVWARSVLGQTAGSTELSEGSTTVVETDSSCDGGNYTDSCVTSETTDEYDANVTDVNPANKTLSTNTTNVMSNTTMAPATTAEPRTDTTTAVPSAAPPARGEICFCDLMVNACDVNCCCDGDCSGQDQQVFSSCEDVGPATHSDRHCYQPHFLYHSNTAVQMTPQGGGAGLFCIVADNVPKSLQYPDRLTVKSLSEFSKLRGLTTSFGWPAGGVDSEMPVFDPPFTYKAGGIVWTSKNSTVLPLSVPVNVVHATCQVMRAVQYLKDRSSSCTRAISVEGCDPSGALGAASYYEGINVITAPQLINITQLADAHQVCTQNTCMPITPYLCSNDASDVTNCSKSENISVPVKDGESGTCLDAVKKVHYVFTHNGTQGIVHVGAFFWFVDIPRHQRYATQMFSVSFSWARDGEAISSRSGRRGYIVGKPLLLGRKVAFASPNDPEEEVEVVELEDASPWLTTPKAMLSGKCDTRERQVVTFGDNRKSSCVLPLSVSNFSSGDTCMSVQKQIMRLMLGSAIDNLTDAKSFNQYVGVFGDSDVETLGEWAQIVVDGVPSVQSSSRIRRVVCQGIVTNLHFSVLVSYVGNVMHPQVKVVGVSVEFGGPKEVVFECDLPRCANVSADAHSVMLTSSVMFTDITEPAIVHFAEPPVFKIKLPNDFFYPFFANAVQNGWNNNCGTFIFIMLLTVFCVN